MDIKELARTISGRIIEEPSEYRVYEDYYNVCKQMMKESLRTGVAGMKWLCERISENMEGVLTADVSAGRQLMALHRRALLSAAPRD